MRMPPIPTDRGRSCWSSLARALPYGLRHGGGSGPCGCRWIGTATVDWEGSATGRGKPVLILGRAARARSRSSVQPSVRAGKPTLPLVAAACLTAGQERAACVQARDTAGEGGGGSPRASQREVYKGRGAHSDCTRAGFLHDIGRALEERAGQRRAAGSAGSASPRRVYRASRAWRAGGVRDWRPHLIWAVLHHHNLTRSCDHPPLPPAFSSCNLSV